MLVILALGTNMKDREESLSIATAKLANILDDIKRSSLYESDAMLLSNSPPEWNKPFLNIAVSGFTNIEPEALLLRTQKIETDMGREADHPTWSPRVIDIDIIAYGRQRINLTHLTIPHPGTFERKFFLMPLAELHPEWQYPSADDKPQKTAYILNKENTKNPFNTKRIAPNDS
jgi:2-amino-4-hydroxy-6-hydroxymethyldihydropteridine diphosphokinase